VTDENEERLEQPEQLFGDWLRAEMEKQNVSIQDLANRTDLSYQGIWNIVRGNTRYPQAATRQKLSAALNQAVPAQIEQKIETESSVSGYVWTDFSPYDLQTIPELAGIYVFYDITERPVYVGKSNSNVRGRVRDHQTRFWFKQPLVMRGSFLAVSEQEMCDKIEMILIKFLGNHALLNFKGVVRDVEN
jgi:transcriptional regulator with XRE-family HTH domain